METSTNTQIERLKSLLIRVLENDEIAKGFNNSNLDEELKQEIILALEDTCYI